MRQPLSLICAMLFLLLGTSACATPAFTNGVVTGTLHTNIITEASGLASSARNPGVLWVHNDSGDGPNFYAIDRNANLLGRYALADAAAVDWEDMALATDPGDGADYLFAADIGDNTTTRSYVEIYKVAEPIVTTNQPTTNATLTGVQTFWLDYPDGAHNAETFLVDPWSGDWFIVTKNDIPSRIYRAPYPQSTGAVITLQYTNSLGYAAAVGGDVARSGRQILIKRYTSVHYYERHPGQTVPDALTSTSATLPYTIEPQGEAVAWTADERGCFTISEGGGAALYFYASTDTDADGLVDTEEVGLGTQTGDADTDDDRQSDAEEIVAGTQPTNASSFFSAALDGGPTMVTLQWLARSNRVYAIEAADLAGTLVFTPIASNISVSANGTIFTNLNVDGPAKAFRVRVSLSP